MLYIVSHQWGDFIRSGLTVAQRFIYETMLKNIILEIIADKKARNIEPTHALFKEVFDRATIEGIAADEIRNGLNELFIAGKIEVGDTLNDKWIRIL